MRAGVWGETNVRVGGGAAVLSNRIFSFQLALNRYRERKNNIDFLRELRNSNQIKDGLASNFIVKQNIIGNIKVLGPGLYLRFKFKWQGQAIHLFICTIVFWNATFIVPISMLNQLMKAFGNMLLKAALFQIYDSKFLRLRMRKASIWDNACILLNGGIVAVEFYL